MADYNDDYADYTDYDDYTSAQQARSPRRGPSVPLALAGLAALGVAGWALIGPDVFESIDVRWILVAAAAAVGLVLVATPRRRHR